MVQAAADWHVFAPPGTVSLHTWSAAQSSVEIQDTKDKGGDIKPGITTIHVSWHVSEEVQNWVSEQELQEEGDWQVRGPSVTSCLQVLAPGRLEQSDMTLQVTRVTIVTH